MLLWCRQQFNCLCWEKSLVSETVANIPCGEMPGYPWRTLTLSALFMAFINEIEILLLYIVHFYTMKIAKKSIFIPIYWYLLYTQIWRNTLCYMSMQCDPKGFIDCMTNFFRYYWFLLDRYKVTLWGYDFTVKRKWRQF